MEESAPGPFRRPGAEPGAAHDLRARGGDSRVHCRRSTGLSTARARTAPAFPLKLIEYRGKKVEQFSFTNETQAREVERTIRCGAGGARGAPRPTRVIAIDRKQRRRNPAPPFTTSTLQQEAARKLGFNARRTMRLAQQLYEGLDIGEGTVGLITYMRTDSVSLAAEAVIVDGIFRHFL